MMSKFEKKAKELQDPSKRDLRMNPMYTIKNFLDKKENQAQFSKCNEKIAAHQRLLQYHRKKKKKKLNKPISRCNRVM